MDLVFHVDRETELPELVVCYKDNSDKFVKDICVDEVFPSKDRFWFDTDVDEKNLCSFLIPDGINSEIAQEKEYIPDVLPSPPKIENLATKSPIFDVLISSEEKVSRNQFSVECNNSKEETSRSENMDRVSDLTGKIEDDSYITKVEARSITFEFKAGVSENLETRNSSRREELSFPAASLSGRIAYSGDLSLRSDNSTTSTASFAFPILQSEWDSSPVRMPRTGWSSRKQKRWWQGLVCCKF